MTFKSKLTKTLLAGAVVTNILVNLTYYKFYSFMLKDCNERAETLDGNQKISMQLQGSNKHYLNQKTWLKGERKKWTNLAENSLEKAFFVGYLPKRSNKDTKKYLG